MNICYRKIISGTALVTLLAFFPGYSFSREVGNTPAGPIEGDMGGFYITGHYHGEFFNNIGEFKGKEDATGVVTQKILGWKKDGTLSQEYKPEYKAQLFAGGGAVGFAMEGLRVELEGLYSQININNKDFTKEENAQYVELQRNNDSSGGTMNTAPINAFASIDTTLRKDTAAVDVPNSRLAAFKMKNEGFRNIAGMVNAYYDIESEDMPVVPYIGIGGGLTQIKFLGKERYAFAYQAKAGVSYAVTPEVKLFAGYRYFGVFGDKLKEVKPTAPITVAAAAAAGAAGAHPARVESTTATIENKFGVHGLEAGVIFNF